MTGKKPVNRERSFGISVGLVLTLIAAILWWRGRVGRAEILGVVGLFLLVCGLVYSPLLKWPSAVWWRFALALGYVNARILLTVLFFVTLVPLSFLWRLTGKDPLQRRRDRFRGWTPVPVRYRNRKHYEQMF
jgi:hypothetical protein